MTLPEFLDGLAVELSEKQPPPPCAPYHLGELVKYYPAGGKPWQPAVFIGCRRECNVNATRQGVSIAYAQWVFCVALPIMAKDGHITGMEFAAGLMGDRLDKMTAADREKAADRG